MTKKKGIFQVSGVENINIVNQAKKVTKNRLSKVNKEKDKVKISDALAIIGRQMEILGYRERTIRDYKLHVNHLVDIVGVNYLNDITTDSIYYWLDSMQVSNQTKLIRLKCLKAFLTKCYENDWYNTRFWNRLNIKVDENLKPGATDKDINLLLSLIDITEFVGLRDLVAILLMYKCGLRIRTVSLLEEKHIDMDNLVLRLSGDILKNRQNIVLPFDEQTRRLLTILIGQNKIIRDEYGHKNNYLIITRFGESVIKGTNNALQRRLNKYAKEYGLKNINPHALRRGFAMRLREQGADVVLISRALGHSDLAVTTKYLGTEKEETANELRRFF